MEKEDLGAAIFILGACLFLVSGTCGFFGAGDRAWFGVAVGYVIARVGKNIV
jgi:hypothetical protein